MTAAPGLGALAGSLQLRPGAAHSLVNRRPQGFVRALRGQPAAALPGLLAGLFSACGAVHRLGAELTLASATSGRAAQPDAAQRRLLQWHTLRAHLQAITLDWPRLLAVGDDRAAGAGLALLAEDPLRRAGSQPDPAALAALPGWLQARIFHQPLADWLTAWQADPATALRCWAERHAGAAPVAGWLQRCRSIASRPLPAVPALRAHADAAGLRALVDEALAAPAGTPGPTWHGRSADTGPATRLSQPSMALPTAWLRLGARLADLARLALPDDEGEAHGRHLLALGALPLSAGAAVAWVETSRGLLLQALWLAPDATLRDALVVSPTDWNSHPAGGFAQALSALPADAPEAVVQALVAAYDPCVPCVIETPAAQAAEAAHA